MYMRKIKIRIGKNSLPIQTVEDLPYRLCMRRKVSVKNKAKTVVTKRQKLNWPSRKSKAVQVLDIMKRVLNSMEGKSWNQIHQALIKKLKELKVGNNIFKYNKNLRPTEFMENYILTPNRNGMYKDTRYRIEISYKELVSEKRYYPRYVIAPSGILRILKPKSFAIKSTSGFDVKKWKREKREKEEEIWKKFKGGFTLYEEPYSKRSPTYAKEISVERNYIEKRMYKFVGYQWTSLTVLSRKKARMRTIHRKTGGVHVGAPRYYEKHGITKLVPVYKSIKVVFRRREFYRSLNRTTRHIKLLSFKGIVTDTELNKLSRIKQPYYLDGKLWS